jgi:hypothetical protein
MPVSRADERESQLNQGPGAGIPESNPAPLTSWLCVLGHAGVLLFTTAQLIMPLLVLDKLNST